MRELIKRRVSVAELTLGMYVCELDRPWSDSPFLFQGFPIESEAELAQLRALCRHVFVDESRRLKPAAVRHQLLTPSGKAAQPLATEIPRARAVHQSARDCVRDVLGAVQYGHAVQTAECRRVVRAYLDSLERNESALLWLSRIKAVDDYTAQHCLAVSILAMGFARALGWSESEVETAGLSGLLHDVGKMQVDLAVLNKAGRLSAEEFVHIQQHASFGYRALATHVDLPRAVVDAAHAHHERLDGRGYPRGLRGEDISPMTRLVSICDCYDAITSQRCYDRARAPKEAFKALRDARDTQLDGDMVLAFINWLGIYPVGSIVQLHNGQSGIVLESLASRRLRPRIAVMRDEFGAPMAAREIDLSALAYARDDSPWRIRDSLPDGSFGLKLADREVQTALTELS